MTNKKEDVFRIITVNIRGKDHPMLQIKDTGMVFFESKPYCLSQWGKVYEVMKKHALAADDEIKQIMKEKS